MIQVMRLIEELLLDVRYALRGFRRHPGVTAVAVMSLALGIGANTATFTAIDVLMVRRLPIADPDRLVVVIREFPGYGTADNATYPALALLRDAGIFESVTATSSVERSGVRFDGAAALDTRTTRLSLVSGNYFSVLGLRAALGRLLEPDDDNSASEAVAVLSTTCWLRRFGGSPDVIGHTFVLNGTTFTIVGVAQAGYTGEDIGDATDAWVPIAFQSQVMLERPGLLQSTGANWVRLLARLKPEGSVTQAEAAVRTVFASLPPTTSSFGTPRIGLGPAGRGFSVLRQSLRTPLLVVSVVVGLVLLLACGNVVMLALARADARRAELAVRLTLGAARSRLVRQLATEGLVLAVMSGAAGFVVAIWLTRVLAALVGSGRTAFAVDVTPDARMLGLTAIISLVTAVLFGLWPALRSSRVPLAATAGSAHGSRLATGPLRSGKTLVIAQVAISIALLISAGLFVRTLANLETGDIGVDRDHVWLFWMAPMEAGRTGNDLAPLFARAQERVTAIPGVVAASSSTDGVLSGFVGLRAVAVSGRGAAPTEDVNAQWNLVGPRFFETMGMPLLAGRDFGAGDSASAPLVAVVNETMARRFFEDARPIGRTFGFGRDLSHPIEIVGIVKDAKYFSAREDPVPMVFLPYQQDVAHIFRLCVVVRTSSDTAGVIDRIRRELADMDAAVPVRLVTSMAEQLDRTLASERLTAWLAGGFGGLALLLASLGLYGIASYSVARRTRELGIRVAIGEPRASILRRVLRDGLALVVAGIAIGGPIGVIAMRSVRSLLFDVGPTEVNTIALAIATLVAVAVAATFVPARRAAAVDPIVALRTE